MVPDVRGMSLRDAIYLLRIVTESDSTEKVKC